MPTNNHAYNIELVAWFFAQDHEGTPTDIEQLKEYIFKQPQFKHTWALSEVGNDLDSAQIDFMDKVIAKNGYDAVYDAIRTINMTIHA